MQQEKLEILKLVYYVICFLLFTVIGNFVGQEFVNHDDRVHRMMYLYN